MRLISAVLVCLLCCGPTSLAQSQPEKLPASVLNTLNRRFRGWKFPDVSPEIWQFLKEHMNGASPVVVSGDFDGNRRRDYAALIQHGHFFNNGGEALPQLYLVVFLRRNTHYKMHVIKDPGGEYIGLAKKGTTDYNYNAQKEITYANDAIFTGIFEKGGYSYVYKNGRFISFISSD